MGEMQPEMNLLNIWCGINDSIWCLALCTPKTVGNSLNSRDVSRVVKLRKFFGNMSLFVWEPEENISLAVYMGRRTR